MGKGRKRGKGQVQDKGRPPRIPSVVFEDEEVAEQLFLEAMTRLDLEPIPVKDADLVPTPSQGGGAKGRREDESTIKLDLHHCGLYEAKTRVASLLDALVTDLKKPVTVMIITGKGRHSGPDGPVLAREIHAFVKNHYRPYILRLEDSPANLVVGELPIRGHFHVTLGRRR